MKINLTTPPILAFFPPIVLLAPKVVVTYILLAGLIFLLFISARRNLRQFTYKKIFFVGLLLPSLVMTLASEEKSEILRYVPLLLMILLYPFKGIQKKHVKTTIGITLAFMILIQIAIGLDYSLAINLRETFYPVEKIIWKSGVFSSGLSIRENRMGGIYYNPNVMGSLTVLSGIIFYVVDKPYKIISIKNISWLIVGLSVILSGSRTAMAVFFMFSYFLVEQHIVQLEKSIYILRTLVFLLLLIFLLLKGLPSIYSQGIFESNGSLNIKLNILFSYINENTRSINGLMTLLLGGIIGNYHFDADLGYILAHFGIFGLVSIVFFLLHVFSLTRSGNRIIYTVFLISIGNTLIYNLQASLMLLVLFILIFSNEKKYNS